MNKLANALQPPAPPTQVPKPVQAPQKPTLDFTALVDTAGKGHKTNRGGLSAAAIQVIQAVYAQDAANNAKPLANNPNTSLEPGWGGQGR